MIKSEFDVLTGEYSERDLTSEEVADVKKMEKAHEEIKKAKADKAEAKASAQAKLAALGLTADEVAAIVGN
jgi:hypothetical protein